MSWNVLLVAIIASWILPANGLCVDWKIYCLSRSGGGETFNFYDHDSIRRTKDKLTVMSQCISREDIYNVSRETQNDVYENTKLRISNGYVPPMAAYHHITDEFEISALISIEERLLAEGYQPLSTSQLEIDCRKDTIRIVSATTYGTAGIASTPPREILQQLAADPGNESLKNMLCKTSPLPKGSNTKKK
jgi:hypothetical protein